MSQWRGHLQEFREGEGTASVVGRWYHVPVLVLLLAFTLWNRVRSWQNFIVDGQVYFSGNDPWYHYRMVSYTVRHWPETMPFDLWTRFPTGTHSSQFGTVFDQIMATFALVVGLGSPDQQTIALIVLFAPALFGTAIGIPTFLIGRRLGGRFGGLVAVTVFVLSSGAAFSRGTVGFADHHIAEAFFQAVAVLGVMAAVTVAEREKPVYELFRNQEFGALRRPVGWATLAGFGVAMYVWTWPPGVFLIGILGVYFTIEIATTVAHGDSPEHVAIAGVVTMAVTSVLTLAAFEKVNVSPTGFNLLQPGLALAGAVWFAFLAWLAREWDGRDLSARLYPVGVAGVLVAIAGVTAVALPDLFGFFVNQTLRVVGFTTSPTAGTVGEAQPLRSIDVLYRSYGLALPVAAVGALLVVVRQFTTRKPRAELTLLVVWLAFVTAAAFTQARFQYYVTVPVAALTAYTVGYVVRYADLTGSIDDIETYQVLTILAVILLVVVPPLTVFQPTVMAQSRTGPGQAVQAWDGSLEWMQDNTPKEGQFGGANNKLSYYGTYDNVENYEYPSGTYGVMSWWDYGHWITVQGKRIPVANPFQQGANLAADFLLAPNETQANDVLNKLSDGPNAKTRYVMVDWKMVTTIGGPRFGGKFFAPPKFTNYNVSQSDYYRPLVSSSGNRLRFAFHRRTQNYYETAVVRLYRYHGSAISPQPVVLDWEATTVRGGTYNAVKGRKTVRQFDNMTAARNYVRKDGTAQVGGIGPFPSHRVPAMEHYRLVQQSERSAYSSARYLNVLRRTMIGAGLIQPRSSIQQFRKQAPFLHLFRPAWVKVFERVPGATVKGQGPANATVTARVRMRSTNVNTTFVYQQRAKTGPDGTFTMTLPYSTTGYEKWGVEEGYTNTSVRATGPYVFQTGLQVNESNYLYRSRATAHVTEGQVIGENESVVRVDLQRRVLRKPRVKSSEQSGTNETSQQSANETSQSPEIEWTAP